MSLSLVITLDRGVDSHIKMTSLDKKGGGGGGLFNTKKDGVFGRPF